MAGWRVERTPRATSGPVPSTRGGSPLAPPHHQGAGRRPERRAGRAGHRWVLRALVIGGLAGVAWLLTGAAAHAAGPEAEPVAGSLFGTTTDDAEPVAENEPVVGELLKAAVQPLEPVPEIHQRVLTVLSEESALFAKRAPGTPDPAVESPVSGTPAPVEGPVEDDESSIDAEPLGDALLTATAPLQAGGGDAAGQERPVAESDVTGPAALPRTPAPAPEIADPSGPPASRVQARQRAVPETDAPARRAGARSRPHVHRHTPAARPVAPETIRENQPGDGPAPTRMNLGAVSGIPAGGPGTNTESGSAAVLPGGTAIGPVACHRCPVAPAADVRRYDAEAPTVSPD